MIRSTYAKQCAYFHVPGFVNWKKFGNTIYRLPLKWTCETEFMDSYVWYICQILWERELREELRGGCYMTS